MSQSKMPAMEGIVLQNPMLRREGAITATPHSVNASP
jgi:hypothetical protein